MSLTSLVIASAVIVVVLFVFAPELVEGLIDDLTGTYSATQLLPRVGSDEIICDLRVQIDADLIQDFNVPIIGSQPYVKINDVDTQYYNCVASSNVSTLDLLDFNHLSGVSNELSVLFVTPQNLETSIKLIDATDSSQQVTSATQPQLKIVESFDVGQSINTPYDVSRTFVITDIPARTFNLEIFYENSALITGIENLEHGKPYIHTVKEL